MTTASESLRLDEKAVLELLKNILPETMSEYGIYVPSRQKKSPGSMSAVFRARKGTKRLIIKCVPVDNYFDPTLYTDVTDLTEKDNFAAFKKEVESLEKMAGSPYCARLYDYSEGQERPVLVISISDRWTVCGFLEQQYERFADRIQESGALYSPLTKRWIKIYGRDYVAAWLGYCVTMCMMDMQKAGITMHRDIKTMNILIDLQNRHEILKNKFILADFGIAHLKGARIKDAERPDETEADSGAASRRSAVNDNTVAANVGTKCYKPPNDDASTWAEDQCWRVDQFMLGRTICELYDILDHSCDSGRIVEANDRSGEFRKNAYGMRDIVWKMIQNNADDRFQSLQELNRRFIEVLNAIRPDSIRVYPDGTSDVSTDVLPSRNPLLDTVSSLYHKTSVAVSGFMAKGARQRTPSQKKQKTPPVYMPGSKTEVFLKGFFGKVHGGKPMPVEEKRNEIIELFQQEGRTITVFQKGCLYRAEGLLDYLDQNQNAAMQNFNKAWNLGDVPGRLLYLSLNRAASSVQDYAALYQVLRRKGTDKRLLRAVCYALKQFGKQACETAGVSWKTICSQAKRVAPMDIICWMPQ